MPATQILLRKNTLSGTPYVGLFGLATSAFVLLPPALKEREMRDVAETTNARPITGTIAGAGLWGVLALANQNGVIVPAICETREMDALKRNGLRVERVDTSLALGNLIMVNDQVAIGPASLPKSVIHALESVLKVTYHGWNKAGTGLLGAGSVLTNRGFLISPQFDDADIAWMEEKTGLLAVATTANYGDPWIGNCILANDHGGIAGENSSPAELLHIDEGLSGKNE